LKRRREAGQVQDQANAETKALAAWLAETYPLMPRATAKTIFNSLRSEVKEAVAEAKARKERPK
jgi:hypothetical protein